MLDFLGRVLITHGVVAAGRWAGHHPVIAVAIVAGVLLGPRLLGYVAGLLARLFVSPERVQQVAAREARRDDFHAQMRRDQEAKALRLLRAREEQQRSE